VPLCEHDGQQNTEQRKNRSDGKIDAACDYDDPDTDTEDTEGADQSSHVLNVRRTQKLRILEGHHNTQRDKQRKDP